MTKRDKRALGLILLMVPILGWQVLKVFLPAGVPSPAAAASSDLPAPAPPPRALIKFFDEDEQNDKTNPYLDAQWGEDPFDHDDILPPPEDDLPVAVEIVEGPEQPPLPKLTAVMVTVRHNYAQIDGKLVREGQMLKSGYRVISIQKSGAVLEWAEREFNIAIDRPKIGNQFDE